MKLFLKSETARARPETNLFVCPARDMPPGVLTPSEFLERDGEAPRQFTVTFRYGQAEVPDALGFYLLDRGHAQRTALIIPT